ncbi:MAG: hypothetical protein GDA49_10005 [Rhodospirillales bacterium]|nr:hypothetical protein [Rhodospirillales bacterium]
MHKYDTVALVKSLEFIEKFKAANPSTAKCFVKQAWIEWASPERVRSVFVADGFALRFSEAKTGSFSNTVLSLSALAQHDMYPFVVVVVRPISVDFLLANATFLKKISHSSQQLRIDNIKGSFNGTDIMTTIAGIPNTPEHFDDLFALHSAFTWEENLGRLVESTNGIVPRNIRFQPTNAEIDLILDAPVRFANFIVSKEYTAIERDLNARIRNAQEDIIAAARSDNVNIRGNTIEKIITGEGNTHELSDLVMWLGDRKLMIDVKTKLLDRSSAPKAYNVDKFLRLLSKPDSVFAFFIVGLDVMHHKVFGRLLTVLDDALRNLTVVQHHWAGRGSRGVTQLYGDFGQALFADYQPSIDIDSARGFLKSLIEL